MSKIYTILAIIIVTCACFDDKGNYNYGELDELVIELPEESYSLLFGEKLQITPTIETAVPESDLAYDWEFYGKNPAYSGSTWKEYVPVYQGKALDYTCLYDEYILPGEGSYLLRLNVTQLSTGRHFYSEAVTVKLLFQPTHLGAVVLHGDAISSDIGIVVSEDFQPTRPSKTFEAEVYPHYYSEANRGEKIDGRGQWIMQTFSRLSDRTPENIVVLAVTDKATTLAHSKNLLKTGEWNDLFYGGINQGKPEACFINSTYLFIMDGGDVYKKMYNKTKFSVPMYTAAYNEYDFYPRLLIMTNKTLMQGLLFDRAKRGFVAVLGVLNNFNRFSPIDARAEGGTASVPFNPAQMDADLVHMDMGGRANHVLAVMRGDGNRYFMVDINVAAASFSAVPQYRYDLMHLPDVRDNRVIDWAFGTSFINMCYYATPNGVYRFSADDGKTVQPEPLMTSDNTTVSFNGSITLMKILKPDISGGYYKTNVEMVVGTYGGTPGSGILYSIELEPNSGRALSVREYTGFDEIHDVNIKGY